MAAIGRKDTKPELAVRSLLHELGYRFRLQTKGVPGRPDIVFRGRRKAIFVHGCFWHSHEGCRLAKAPKSRTSYWLPKLARNKARDLEVLEQLEGQGWDSLVIWECEAVRSPSLADRLRAFLGPTRR
jgi:DNA mismatch endonuclease (patch repair protein)